VLGFFGFGTFYCTMWCGLVAHGCFLLAGLGEPRLGWLSGFSFEARGGAFNFSPFLFPPLRFFRLEERVWRVLGLDARLRFSRVSP
jgi:hypothetical protein